MPLSPERDRSDILTRGHDAEHHLAACRDPGGGINHIQAKADGAFARISTARIAGESVPSGEEVADHFAAHVADADKSETHGYDLSRLII